MSEQFGEPRNKEVARRPDEPKAKPAEPGGLRCLNCGCGHFYVVYTKQVSRGRIRRRRQCRFCGRRITTYEQESD